MRILLLLALAILAGSCALPKLPDESSPTTASQPPAKKPESQEEERSDEAIGADVRRQLDIIGAADTAGMVVEVNNRVVTLRGVAPTIAAAWRAEGAARAVAGVKSVVNQLQAFGQTTTP